MILFLDTSGFEEVHFALIATGLKEQRYPLKRFDSEKTLTLLERFLKKNKVKLQSNSFGKIIVVSGAGSFTGIRTGIAISLAFSLAFDIPVYAIKKDKLPKVLSELKVSKDLKKITAAFNADYGAEPHITPAKRISSPGAL